jgi:endo-1,4-beta-xylanase
VAALEDRARYIQRVAVHGRFHFTGLLSLTLLTATAASCAELTTTHSLRAAADGVFTIGVGIHDHIPERPSDWPLLTAQFSSVTPENCLKPDPVQVVEGKFNFTRADGFVDFAHAKGLQVVGHCLVWAKDDRTPPWFFRDGTNIAGRDVLLARMKTHIDTVAGRYRGRIALWDVVNEALDDGTNFLRPSGWSAACGEEFIVKAFEFAHAADPKALLVYNDYNNELPAKRAKLIRLVRALREKNAPVHAVGLQGHYEIDRIPLSDIEATLVAMRELRMKVVVSELDIDVVPRGKWWADGGKDREELAKLDPYREGCPPEILQRQADQYAQLFRLFRKYSDVIVRVSFWNLHDGQSWLNTFPWRRVNYPLLFDREGKPKPAFNAVVAELQKAKE